MLPMIRTNEEWEEKDVRVMENTGSRYSGDTVVIVERRISEI
jgi:hypothetical protein